MAWLTKVYYPRRNWVWGNNAAQSDRGLAVSGSIPGNAPPQGWPAQVRWRWLIPVGRVSGVFVLKMFAKDCIDLGPESFGRLAVRNIVFVREVH